MPEARSIIPRISTSGSCPENISMRKKLPIPFQFCILIFKRKRSLERTTRRFVAKGGVPASITPGRKQGKYSAGRYRQAWPEEVLNRRYKGKRKRSPEGGRLRGLCAWRRC